MSQSSKNSAIEVVVNVGSGYVVGMLVQVLIFPYFGLSLSLADNALITLVFTVASMVRGYMIRRLFNKYRND